MRQFFIALFLFILIATALWLLDFIKHFSAAL